MTEDSASVGLLRNEQTVAKASLFKQELFAHLQGPGAFAASAVTFGGAVTTGRVGRESNIVGVGYGVKITAGIIVPHEQAVRVYVRKKASMSDLLLAQRIPAFVNGTPTDVVQVGEIRACSPKTTYNPSECGVSAAHFRVSAGTLACVVRHVGSSVDHVLSCNHVFADCNAAKMGDAILQASPSDGGVAMDPFATLVDFEPLNFARGTVNYIDAAIAVVCDPPRKVLPPIMGIGSVALPPGTAAAPSGVVKHGRSTARTKGTMIDISADISVGYGIQSAEFEDQLAIRDGESRFATRGDSGSLVLEDESSRPVGLLFAVAGEEGISYANPIGPVLARFGVQIQ